MGRCGSPAEESQEPRFAGAWGLREHIRIRRGWQLICRRTCSNVTPCLGALAQLVARLGRIEKVTGSIPVCSTTMMEGRPVRSPLLSSLCQLCVSKVQHRAIGKRWRQGAGHFTRCPTAARVQRPAGDASPRPSASVHEPPRPPHSQFFLRKINHRMNAAAAIIASDRG